MSLLVIMNRPVGTSTWQSLESTVWRVQRPPGMPAGDASEERPMSAFAVKSETVLYLVNLVCTFAVR